MITACVLVLLTSGAAGTQDGVFQDALDRVAEGRFAEALRVADQPQLSTLERAQARTWVFQRAGLLDLALAEAEAGLEAHPRDEWLLSRGVELAVSLHDSAAAETLLASLQEARETPEADPLREQVEELAAGRELQDRGLSRARLASWVLLVLSAGLFACWLRPTR